ncbi:MAG: helix-turn-helix domain-containing protein [Candidatus Woesearchaeota archaeon]
MNTELLKEIGLSEGEIKVYLALFKIGSSSTGAIIKEAGVHASKVYPILDRLIEKGLVSFIKEGKKTIYTANPATTIISYLEKLQNNINEQKTSANKLIHDLEQLKKLGGKETEATIFKGIKGLKNAYQIIASELKGGEECYAMFLPPVENEVLLFFNKFNRDLSNKKTEQHFFFNEYSQEIEGIKHLPRVHIKIGVSKGNNAPAEMCVYGDYTIISTSGGDEYLTVLVKNEVIAESFRKQFRIIWHQQASNYSGIEGAKAVFNEALSYKEIRFIGGNWGPIKYFPEFFKSWNEEREKRKIQWYDLLDVNLLIKTEEQPPSLKYYQARILPEQVTNPSVIFMYGDKVVNIIWKENPLITVIENKEIKEHYLRYFEYLWKQEVLVSHGMKALMRAHEKTYQKLKKGEEYLYLGVPKYQPEEQHEYWKLDHEHRIKAGINTRILFNQDTSKEVLRNRNSYSGCDARYMPTEIKTPSYMGIFKDTVMIAIPKKEPIVIEIENQEIANSFKAYFEDFWRKSKKFS